MKALLCLMFVGLLVGCNHNPPAPPIQNYTVFDADKVIPVKPPAPPEREAYINLSADDKEQVLTNYSLELNTVILECNNKLDSLRLWRQSILKLQIKE
jgi:hypothetical protein